MMSMYNLIFGQNKHSDLILALLHLKKESVGRFRDAFITNGEIAVYTRNGGGNREHWDYTYDNNEGADCPCPGCIITHHLPKHPNYLRDEDDDFDSTYATIYFSIPTEIRELANSLESGNFNPDDRWAEKITTLENESPNLLKTKYPELCAIINSILKVSSPSIREEE